jgi:hypothetical protein
MPGPHGLVLAACGGKRAARQDCAQPQRCLWQCRTRTYSKMQALSMAGNHSRIDEGKDHIQQQFAASTCEIEAGALHLWCQHPLFDASNWELLSA